MCIIYMVSQTLLANTVDLLMFWWRCWRAISFYLSRLFFIALKTYIYIGQYHKTVKIRRWLIEIHILHWSQYSTGDTAKITQGKILTITFYWYHHYVLCRTTQSLKIISLSMLTFSMLVFGHFPHPAVQKMVRAIYPQIVTVHNLICDGNIYWN